MKLNTILFFILLTFSPICNSQSLRKIHSVDIIKIAKENGKDVGTARFDIDSDGVVLHRGIEKDKVDINTLSASLNELIEKEQEVVKVEGDNDKRPGMQESYNSQHIFITIIFQDDFDNEKNLKNKTCYRYRETNLPIDQKDFSFFKYFNGVDLEIIKKFLQ